MYDLNPKCVCCGSMVHRGDKILQIDRKPFDWIVICEDCWANALEYGKDEEDVLPRKWWLSVRNGEKDLSEPEVPFMREEVI